MSFIYKHIKKLGKSLQKHYKRLQDGIKHAYMARASALMHAPYAIELIGGLGNQLFIYAFARALGERRGCPVLLHFVQHDKDRPLRLDVYNVALPIISDGEASYFDAYFSALPRLREPSLAYSEACLPPRASYLYDSYFQDPRYFSHIRPLLLSELTLREPLDEENARLLHEIESTKASVCLHMRLGDYTKGVNASLFAQLDMQNYYIEAINTLASLLMHQGIAPREICFYVFSNDIATARKRIASLIDEGGGSVSSHSIEDSPKALDRRLENFHFVDINDEQHGYYDLELMRHCAHFIIANSTFSWWASYLCRREGRITIAPSRWFSDARYAGSQLLLDSFIKVEVAL